MNGIYADPAIAGVIQKYYENVVLRVNIEIALALVNTLSIILCLILSVYIYRGSRINTRILPPITVIVLVVNLGYGLWRHINYTVPVNKHIAAYIESTANEILRQRDSVMQSQRTIEKMTQELIKYLERERSKSP